MQHQQLFGAKRLACFVLALALLANCQVAIIEAQEQSSAPAIAKNETAPDKYFLGFRMLDWKAKHINDPKLATAHAETLRKLGCEVKANEHAGHTDVSCRTVFWKSLALDSPQQLEQWQTWLNAAGFDTLYGKPASDQTATNPDGSPKEIVKYRLADWRTQHVQEALEIGQLETMYRSLGCEFATSKHSGHVDFRYRCPEWKQVELPTHDAAHKWQEYLNKAGFETAHSH